MEPFACTTIFPFHFPRNPRQHITPSRSFQPGSNFRLSVFSSLPAQAILTCTALFCHMTGKEHIYYLTYGKSYPAKKEQSGAFLCRSGPDRWVWCGMGHPAKQLMHTEPKNGGGLRPPRRSRQSSQLRPLYLHVDRIGI